MLLKRDVWNIVGLTSEALPIVEAALSVAWRVDCEVEETCEIWEL